MGAGPPSEDNIIDISSPLVSNIAIPQLDGNVSILSDSSSDFLEKQQSQNTQCSNTDSDLLQYRFNLKPNIQ